MNQKVFAVLLLCALCACPAASISRWFSATYNDLKFTLYRYSHCYSGLAPLSTATKNETQFLVHQMRSFLDAGNYDNEQLANVSQLIDQICRPNDANYAVSLHIDLSKFENETGKANRCNAIEDAMDSMYYVFRRAALNRSEPLDFSTIQFYPNASNRNASYGLIDLINVSWIKSNIDIENVCIITNPIKEYVALKASNASAQARADQPAPAGGPVNLLLDFLNRFLDPLLGLQKRLYWEGTNRLGQIQTRLSSGVGSLRDGLGAGLDRTRKMIFGGGGVARSNATLATAAAAAAAGSGPRTVALNATNASNATSAPQSLESFIKTTTPAPVKPTSAAPGSSTASPRAPAAGAAANATNAI